MGFFKPKIFKPKPGAKLWETVIGAIGVVKNTWVADPNNTANHFKRASKNLHEWKYLRKNPKYPERHQGGQECARRNVR